MATQEEFIKALISRLQQPENPPATTSAFNNLNQLPQSQFPSQQANIGQVEQGSLASGFAPPAQQPVQQQAPPPQAQPERDLNLFGGFDRAFLPEAAPIQEEESQNVLMQAGRGFGRGVAQGTLTLGEGLFATADMVTNLAGYEDAIDPATSEALKLIQDSRKAVGNEEGMVGKLAEALGSMVPLLVPGLGAAGVGTRAAGFVAKGAGYAEAARRNLGYAKGLKALSVVTASTMGGGTANQMLEAYEDAGNEVSTAKRNLAVATGLGIGLLDLAPMEILLRGIPNTMAKNVTNGYIRRATENITNAGAEGGQEAISGMLQELSAQSNYNPDQPIGDSALSDFGYGAGAGSIVDMLFGRRVKYAKNQKEIDKEYQGTEQLESLDEEFLKDMQTSEKDVAFYDSDGNQQAGQVVDFGDDFVTLSVGDDLVNVPRDQSVDEQSGDSLASDKDLLTPRFKINNRELGDFSAAELIDEQTRQMLPQYALDAVDAGDMSLGEALNIFQSSDGTMEVTMSAGKAYRIKAIRAEMKRRNPDFDQNISEKAAKNESDVATGLAVDSGEIGDFIAGTMGDNQDTVLGRVVSDTDVSRGPEIEASVLVKAFKRNKVNKTEQKQYIEEVTGDANTPISDLDSNQKALIHEKVVTHQARKAAKKDANKAADDLAKTEEEIERRAAKLAEGSTKASEGPAPTPVATADTPVTPEAVAPAPVTPEPVVEEVVAEEPAAFEPVVFDSKDVANSKPRYRDEIPEFESLLDKALYIVRDGVKKSKKDASIINELKAALPGMTEADIRRMGTTIAAEVKERGEAARKANQSVFKIPTVVPQQAPQVEAAQPVAVQPEVAQVEVVQPEAEAEDSGGRKSYKIPFDTLDDVRSSTAVQSDFTISEVQNELRSEFNPINDAVTELAKTGEVVSLGNGRYRFTPVPTAVDTTTPDSESTQNITLDLVPPQDSAAQVKAELEQIAQDDTGQKPKKKKKGRLQKDSVAVVSPVEEADIRDTIGELSGGDAKALQIGMAAYRKLRDNGADHNTARTEFSVDPEFQDQLVGDINFARPAQQSSDANVALTAIPNLNTPQGPSILVPQKDKPIDYNQFIRIKKIVNNIAPEADLVVASQLYGQVTGEGAERKFLINGQEVGYDEALGLQVGNVVAVSVADGHLDPENVAYHEATHFLFNNGFLNDSEIKSLIANQPRLERIVLEHLGQKQYDLVMSGNEFQNFNELIAYSSALYNRGLDIDGKIPPEFTPPLRRAFAKIARLFKQLKSNFTGEFIPMELEQVFEQVRQGRAGKRTPDKDSVKRIKSVMLASDPTGMSSATPLAVIKQGPIAASSTVTGVMGRNFTFSPDTPQRPAFKSKLKGILEEQREQKYLPDAWGRIKETKNGSSVAGRLTGVKVDEFNDSGLGDYLNRLPADKSVKGEDLLEFFEDREQVVEIQIYGAPIGANRDAQTEREYQDALRQDRNNEAYEQIANDAITSLRLGRGAARVVDVMTTAINVVSLVPNPAVADQAFPESIVKAVRDLEQVIPELRGNAAEVQSRVDTFNDGTTKKLLNLANAISAEDANENSPFNKTLLGLTLVDTDSNGVNFQDFDFKNERAGFSPTSTLDVGFGYVGGQQGSMGFSGGQPNFYYAWTTMGGRELAEVGGDLFLNKNATEALERLKGYRDIIYTIPLTKGEGIEHVHYPNVRNAFMHMRLADIVLDDGTTVLVVEEIQSDVHQAAQRKMREMATEYLYADNEISQPDYEALTREEKNLVRPMMDMFASEVYGKLVPDLPMKKENSRLQFAMHQLVRMAINGGYDHIAVSNGDLQVERYRNAIKANIDGLVLTKFTNTHELVESGIIESVNSLPGGIPAVSIRLNAAEFEADTRFDNEFLRSDAVTVDGDGNVSVVLTEAAIQEELNELRQDGSFEPAYPDPNTGEFDDARALGGLEAPSSLNVDEEQRDVIAQNKLEQAQEEVANFVSEPSAQLSFDAASIKKATQGIKAEFMPATEATSSELAQLAIIKAITKAYPQLAQSWIASYTQPVIGKTREGGEVGGSFFRDSVELGNNNITMEGNPSLDQWLGEDIAVLVRNELDNPAMRGKEFHQKNFIKFIQDKAVSVEVEANKLANGETNLTDYQKSVAKLVTSAKDRTTGAIDIPVGGGFKNVYDVKIPQALDNALASLHEGSNKEIKKIKDKIAFNSKDNLLYLGSSSGEFLPASQYEGTSDILPEGKATIIKASDIQSQPLRGRPIAAISDETTALKEALAENDSIIDKVAEETGFKRIPLDKDAPDGARMPMFRNEDTNELKSAREFSDEYQNRYMIPVSNSRNALRLYTLTEDMKTSPQVSAPSEIYFARVENERTAATNQGTDNLRGVMKNGRQKGIDFINSLPFFNTLKDMPEKKEFYLERAKYLGTVAQSTKIATFLRDEIGNQFLARSGSKNRASTEALRGAIFQYLTTGDAQQEAVLLQQLGALDPRAAKASAKAKDMIEKLGLELMQAGLLPANSFYKYRRSYLPRIYLKNVLEDKMDARFSYLKPRKDDMTDQAQEALGVINELDPAFLVSRAIQRPVRDLQFIEFMNSVAGNEAWTVADDQFVVEYTGPDGKPQKVSGFYLLDQVNTLTSIAAAVEAADPDKAVKLRSDAAQIDSMVRTTFEERGVLQYITDPNIDISGITQTYGFEFKRVPRGRQYGMLAGRLVRQEIFDDVVASSAMLNIGDQAYVNILSTGRKATAIWKTIKVPLNPPTIARNTFSNAILMHLSGVPFYRVIPRMVEAAREIVAYNNKDFENSKHYAAMIARGVQQSSFTDQELILMQDDMLDFLRSVDAKDLGMIGWLKLNTWTRLAQKASKLYQGIEVVGKTAIAIDVMEREGGTADDAFMRAQEYLFDYSDVPQTVRAIRQSPVGIPFLTFQYKVLPVLAKTALRNPMKFAPYVALSYALPSLFMSAFDIDDEEYEAVKKAMPDYLRGNPGLIPVPARDSKGRLQFLDTSYLYPWGSFTGLLANSVSGGKQLFGAKKPEDQGFSIKDVTSTLGMFGGPAWSLAGAAQNLDPFTQRPIVNPEDPMFVSGAIEKPFYRRGKMTDAMFWAANQYLLPGFLNTEYGAVAKLNTALKGDRKANGIEADTLGQAIMRFVGLNLTNVDPLQIQMSLRYLDGEKSKITTQINRLRKDQSLSVQERERRIGNYYEVLSSYKQKKAALIQAGRTSRNVTERLRRKDTQPSPAQSSYTRP